LSRGGVGEGKEKGVFKNVMNGQVRGPNYIGREGPKEIRGVTIGSKKVDKLKKWEASRQHRKRDNTKADENEPQIGQSGKRKKGS